VDAPSAEEPVAHQHKLVSPRVRTLILMAIIGCHPPPPRVVSTEVRPIPPPPSTPINCAQQTVRNCGPSAIGPVNTCLANDDQTWRDCLFMLIKPGECGGEAVLACVVEHSRAASVVNTATNPDDRLSVRQAERAGAWIAERGYTFTP
jgi:hypothetical protein